MKMSARGLALLKSFEGFRPEAYPDPATGGEPWTIGFGSTHLADGTKVHKGMKITEAEGEELLRATLARYEKAVLEAVQHPLTQNKFDACVSLCYNVGPANFHHSSVREHADHGRMRDAANAFLLWDKANHHVMPGLHRRRVAERELFLQDE